MNINDQIASFYELIYKQNFDPEDLDYSEFESRISFLDKLSEVENSSVYVYDFYQKKYAFMRSKFSDQVGYNIDESIAKGPAYMLSLTHLDDIPIMVETFRKSKDFLLALPIEERKNYKIIFNFRIKGTSGTYFHFIQQVVVLELDKKGNIWLILVLSDLLPDKTRFTKVHRKLVNIKTGKQYFFDEDNRGRPNHALTTREVEILGLVSKGFVSKEIADRLFLSVNTVNNHRQKILEKINATNTTEAVTYARNLGLL